MPRFFRLFFCRNCQKRGNLDELTAGVIVIECPPCEVSEVWDSTDLGKQLDHFHFSDEIVPAQQYLN